MSIVLYHRFLNYATSYPKYKQLLERNKSCDDNYVLEKAYNLSKIWLASTKLQKSFTFIPASFICATAKPTKNTIRNSSIYIMTSISI